MVLAPHRSGGSSPRPPAGECGQRGGHVGGLSGFTRRHREDPSWHGWGDEPS